MCVFYEMLKVRICVGITIQNPKTSEQNITVLKKQKKKVGEDGWLTWYGPVGSKRGLRLPQAQRTVSVWGHICQMLTPVVGVSGFLPVTGVWTDTFIHAQVLLCVFAHFFFRFFSFSLFLFSV